MIDLRLNISKISPNNINGLNIPIKERLAAWKTYSMTHQHAILRKFISNTAI